MKSRLVIVGIALASMTLIGCGKPKPRPQSGDVIADCLNEFQAGSRWLAALERTVVQGDVFVRPKTVLTGDSAKVELYHLVSEDGAQWLAVFSSKEKLVAALGDGTYARFRGSAVQDWNVKQRVVLNYGSEQSLEWDVGQFGEALRKSSNAPACPAL